MDPSDSQYHVVLTIILISLIIAAGISVLFTPVPVLQREVQGQPGQFYSNSTEEDKKISWIVRILWVDDQNQTYSFQDYPQDTRPDPDTYVFSGTPPIGAQPAMIRFLTWDGNLERTEATRYVMDEEQVTTILNQYSLTASRIALPSPTTRAPQTPVPVESPRPGMIIPELGSVCRNRDGSYTATFGYTSRYDRAVNLPVGDLNRFYPGSADRGQPVVFLPGTHHNVFSVTYPPDATNQVWSVMNTVVSAGTVPELNTTIHVEPTSGYAPLEVRVHQRSTGSATNNPLFGMWDLGDGTITTEEEPFFHRYERPGRYVVRYTISNTCGQAEDTQIVVVYNTSFTWERDLHDPRIIRFHAPSGGDPSVWFWDFGDGYTSWEENPVHTYLRSGTYKVGMTISGQHGKGSSVQSIPIPEF